MPLLIVLALMALPFAEIWLMIAVGGRIGVPWTIALLFAFTVVGVLVLRRAGTRAFREFEESLRVQAQAYRDAGGDPQAMAKALREGESSRSREGMLSALMLMVGGILLLIPGFITAAVGGLLALPFTRPALRWAFSAWADRRARAMGVTVVTAPSDGSGASGASGAPGEGAGRPGKGRVIQGRVVDPTEEPGTAG
ncbi:FxsA family protein [Nocardiopsis suaedae]|uniref:FxsA family protein n=1 Tax=Nocardiopsis suaedae TaxID=3018444 RepID=A0ABT4TTE9_9ACTN|nr:FxsA family protein [Nocardiopsis suaedae]MDA2807962.1 FxsA family protein [Nocardiopsis suaedae]